MLDVVLSLGITVAPIYKIINIKHRKHVTLERESWSLLKNETHILKIHLEFGEASYIYRILKLESGIRKKLHPILWCPEREEKDGG